MVSSRPATESHCWEMKPPSSMKIGKNNTSGLPAATSVSTGTMSVSPILTAVAVVIVPPSSAKEAANAVTRPSAYELPSWMVAAVVAPSSSATNSATAAPWNRSLCAVR